MFYFLEETPSTNDDAKSPRYCHGDVICATRQTLGRGQRGNRWISDEGMNATFSVVLEPTFLEVSEQFLISQIVALSLVEMLSYYNISTNIKWTNDIYVKDKKISGVLIENRLEGERLARSVVGIGINVNQTIFDSSLPNPTSMLLESPEVKISVEEVVTRLHTILMRWYERLKNSERSTVIEAYHSKLYRLGEPHTFRLASGEPTIGIIRGVQPSGALVVEHEDAKRHEYQFREIEFVI